MALPYQLYVETHSAFLVGLLGAAELIPLVTLALLGGALADRYDRRRLLLLDQIALVALAAALAALAFAGSPPVGLLYVLGGLLAGFAALQNVTRSSIVPNLVAPARLPSALALSFGLFQLTLVHRPRDRGRADRRGRARLGLLAGRALVPGVRRGDRADEPAATAPTAGPRAALRSSIGEGLRYVRSNQALMGSFAIDLVAMTFGMPRALFAVLAVSVYGAGAQGTGLLYASVAAGATVAALTTGWMRHAHRLGLITIWAVVAWGVAIAAAGLAPTLWLAAVLLALAGAADSVSAVCRSTINQSVTPDHLRGRMSSVFSLVVTSGPRLGDVESGAVAGLTSPRFSVSSGGLLCVAGAGLVVLAFPALARYDKGRALERGAEAEAAALARTAAYPGAA